MPESHSKIRQGSETDSKHSYRGMRSPFPAAAKQVDPVLSGRYLLSRFAAGQCGRPELPRHARLASTLGRRTVRSDSHDAQIGSRIGARLLQAGGAAGVGSCTWNVEQAVRLARVLCLCPEHFKTVT